MAQPLNAKARLCTSRLALYKAHECKFGSFFVHAQACGDIIDIVIGSVRISIAIRNTILDTTIYIRTIIYAVSVSINIISSIILDIIDILNVAL